MTSWYKFKLEEWRTNISISEYESIVNECVVVLTPGEQCASYIIAATSYFLMRWWWINTLIWDFYSVSSLTQLQSTCSHVAGSLLNPLPNSLYSYPRAPCDSRRNRKTNYICILSFRLTRTRIEPITLHTLCEHANHYTKPTVSTQKTFSFKNYSLTFKYNNT